MTDHRLTFGVEKPEDCWSQNARKDPGAVEDAKGDHSQTLLLVEAALEVLDGPASETQ